MDDTSTGNDDNDDDIKKLLATILGYLIGLGSLLLYTPTAIRLLRQRSAEGSSWSTWILKVASYTCSDIYFQLYDYPLSTYIDTLCITVEAWIVLILVVHFQRQWKSGTLWLALFVYGTASLYFATVAPSTVVATGQLVAAALNVIALVPQMILNSQQQRMGDYSPWTTTLAVAGNAIRIWTIVQLANADVILLISFGSALLINTALLIQIVYYGMVVERLTFFQVLSADFWTHTPSNRASMAGIHEKEDETEAQYSEPMILLNEGTDLQATKLVEPLSLNSAPNLWAGTTTPRRSL